MNKTQNSANLNSISIPSAKARKVLIPYTIVITIAVLFFILLFFWRFPAEQRTDFKRLATESYDSVFLSMYPIDNYKEEDFVYWRAMDTVITSYEIPDQITLEAYLGQIIESGNPVHTVYLGVFPEKLSGEDLATCLSSYPDIQFHVVFPHPSIDYWVKMPEKACTQLLEKYKAFIPPLLKQPNILSYFFTDSKWLIANPANYENTFTTVDEISLTIMLHLDYGSTYWINPNYGIGPILTLEELIAEEKKSTVNYPDLSGKSIVFFGDSVIGNYIGNTSIAGVTSALTGAITYNLGFGGTPAASSGTNYCLSSIVDAYLAKNPSLLPEDSQAHIGLKQYLADEVDSPYCFYINYGLNDYFNGDPIASDDPYDTSTFEGAFRYSIRALRQAYPSARIIIATPNFTSYFNYGLDAMSEHGHILEDYVDALITVAKESNVELLDNYNELGINANNHVSFLGDGCHPNENGSFLIGQRISEKLSNIQ